MRRVVGINTVNQLAGEETKKVTPKLKKWRSSVRRARRAGAILGFLEEFHAKLGLVQPNQQIQRLVCP